MSKRIALSSIAALGLLMGGNALAAGPYVGIGLGQSSLEIDGTAFDESDTAFKLFGGYLVNDYFGFELAYIDGGAPEAFNVEIDISAINASLVGRVPLGEVFALFGKLGFASHEVDVGPASDREEDLSYGIGASFNIGESFELRAEYEAIDVSDASYNLMSVSGVFKF